MDAADDGGGAAADGRPSGVVARGSARPEQRELAAGARGGPEAAASGSARSAAGLEGRGSNAERRGRLRLDGDFFACKFFQVFEYIFEILNID